MQELEARSGVPLDTLKTWRKRLLNDPNWRPDPHRKATHTVLPEELEKRIAEKLREEFIKPEVYCPPRLLDDLAVAERVAYLTEKGQNIDKVRNFKHSNRWRDGFLERNALSIRKFHYKRRCPADPAIVCQFLTEYEIAKAQFRFENILNMDETSWRIVDSRMVTVANRGQDAVRCVFGVDQKCCITVIATITRSGEKLPLWVVATGLTDKVHEKFLQDDRLQTAVRQKRLVLTHSRNGWTDTDIAKQYLQWIHPRNNDAHKYLIWDIFAAHRAADVRAFAQEQAIQLSFIPGGMTGEYQPLDYRVFGILKQRAKQRFDKAVILATLRGKTYEPSLPDAVSTLLEVWGSLSQNEILDAWTCLE